MHLVRKRFQKQHNLFDLGASKNRCALVESDQGR